MPNKKTDDKPNRDGRGYFLPGPGSAGPGRPKGSQNAITMDLKMALTEAFWEVGGVGWLVKLAQEEPKAFAGLLARLLPPTPPDDDREMIVRVIGGFTNDGPDPDV